MLTQVSKRLWSNRIRSYCFSSHKPTPPSKLHAPFGTNVYKKHFEKALKDPSTFWGAAAKEIDWIKPWDEVLDSSNPPFYRWFKGGQTNACLNALDRHLPARSSQKAIIYDSPLTGKVEFFTYAELHAHVEQFAGVLRDQGVVKGDIVLIYMPMIPQAAIAMLACARIGAVHTVVFGGFASEQLAIRIGHAEPKVIVTASCGVEPNKTIAYKPLLDAGIEASPWKPSSVIVFQRPNLEPSTLLPGRDFDWDVLMSKARPFRDCEPMLATDPLYMLYTSGTTGTPKAIMRDIGGYCVALNWSLRNAFDLNPGNVIFTASDVGWVVGHSYIIYGPLIRGLSSVLYEGKPLTPDAGAFWRVISDHRVNAFFTAPTAFRTIKREDPDAEYVKKYDVSSLRSIWVAGEHADPNTIEWLQHNFPGIPVVDNAWQTETGWPITANPLGLEEHPVKPGSSCRPMPGYNLQVLTDAGLPCEAGELGNLAIQLPLPPGTLPTLFKNDEAYKKSYLERFPGFYNTGDAGIIDADGYVYFMARTDDIINVSGVRLSTGAIEEVISEHPAVAECAVIGPKDQLRGQIPIGLVVLKSKAKQNKDEVIKEIIDMVRNRIGAVAYFRACAAISHLPKTRSGKILRKTIKSMADGEKYSVPATIDNPAVLDLVQEALIGLGFPGTPIVSSSSGNKPSL